MPQGRIAAPGPGVPFGGMGILLVMLDGRNFARLMFDPFVGCHNWRDVFFRILQLDDQRFVVLIVSLMVVYGFGHGLVRWAIGLAGGKIRNRGGKGAH